MPPPPLPPKGPSAHFYWRGESRTKARRRPPRGVVRPMCSHKESECSCDAPGRVRHAPISAVVPVIRPCVHLVFIGFEQTTGGAHAFFYVHPNTLLRGVAECQLSCGPRSGLCMWVGLQGAGGGDGAGGLIGLAEDLVPMWVGYRIQGFGHWFVSHALSGIADKLHRHIQD